MSDHTVAIGRTGLEQTYGELLKELESLEHDLFESGLSEDSLFIDNIILRLRVWASEIDIQGGTLIALTEIGTLASKIQSRLDDIRSLTKDAGTFSTQRRPLAETKSQFLESLDSLAMVVEAIKTIRIQSSTDRKDYASAIEAHLRMSSFKEWIRQPNWFLLRDPLARARFPHLLGVIVTDPRSPADTEIPNTALTELVIEGLVMERVFRDVFMSESSSKSRQSYSSRFQAPMAFSRLITSQLLAFERLQDHANDVRKMLNERKSNKAFLITGVMSATDLSLEHGKYNSSSWKVNMPASGGEASGSAEGSTEASVSFKDGKEMIFALRYQAIRITRFSKKLRRVDMDIKKNKYSFF